MVYQCDYDHDHDHNNDELDLVNYVELDYDGGSFIYFHVSILECIRMCCGGYDWNSPCFDRGQLHPVKHDAFGLSRPLRGVSLCRR
jgi:hypothetical protein